MWEQFVNKRKSIMAMNILINSFTWLVGKYRYTVQSCYNLVEFLKNSYNRHPIAHCKGEIWVRF